MKQENLVRQRLLVESIKNQRRKQIEALKVGITSFQTTPQLRQAGTYACAALYLAVLADWLEIQIAMELNSLDSITRPAEIEAQVDCRLAMKFGGLNGVGQLGELSNEFIVQSQHVLNKAGLLALCGSPDRQLKAFDGTKDDALSAAILEADELPSHKLQHVKTYTALTVSFEKRCTSAANVAELTIASMSTTTCAMVLSRVLKQLANVLNKPCSLEIYPDTTVGNPDVAYTEITVGKTIAESIAADIASNFIRKRISWASLSLN